MASQVPNVNHGAQGLIADWILVGASCLVVLLRFYTQGVIMKRLGWGDFLMALSLLAALAHAIVMTEAFHYGWGRHSQFLADADRIHATKWIFVSQGLGVVAPMLGRLSFCIYLFAVIGHSSRWQRISLYVLMALQVAINVVCVVMIFAQCGVHITALWGAMAAKCLEPSIQTDYGYFQSAFNSLSDLYLTVLPGIIVWILQIRPVVKAGLAVLLCLSVFAFAASVVKTYEIHILSERGDITFNFVAFVIWAALEINIVIIVASIPTLAPIFKKPGRKPTYPDHEYELKGKASGPSKVSRLSAFASGSSRDARGPGIDRHCTLQSLGSQEDILSQGNIEKKQDFEMSSCSATDEDTSARGGKLDYGW